MGNRSTRLATSPTCVLGLLWVLWLALLTAGLGGHVDPSGWLSAHETALKAASSVVLVVAAWCAAATTAPALRSPALDRRGDDARHAG